MKIFYLSLVSIILLMACNSQPSEQEEKKLLSDSLFDEVMAGHDVAMPKMMKLERMQRQTKEAIDSISKLPAAKQMQLADYKTQLDSTLRLLNYGDFTMTKWMEEFKYDSLKNNEPERIKYLQTELEKVNKMKAAVLEGISKADSLFAK